MLSLSHPYPLCQVPCPPAMPRSSVSILAHLHCATGPLKSGSSLFVIWLTGQDVLVLPFGTLVVACAAILFSAPQPCLDIRGGEFTCGAFCLQLRRSRTSS